MRWRASLFLSFYLYFSLFLVGISQNLLKRFVKRRETSGCEIAISQIIPPLSLKSQNFNIFPKPRAVCDFSLPLRVSRIDHIYVINWIKLLIETAIYETSFAKFLKDRHIYTQFRHRLYYWLPRWAKISSPETCRFEISGRRIKRDKCPVTLHPWSGNELLNFKVQKGISKRAQACQTPRSYWLEKPSSDFYCNNSRASGTPFIYLFYDEYFNLFFQIFLKRNFVLWIDQTFILDYDSFIPSLQWIL